MIDTMFRNQFFHVTLMLACGVGIAMFQSARAADEPVFAADDLAFFEQKIRPVLVERCYACHSSDAEANKRLKGGLRVDSRAGLLRGGDSGPAVIAGNSAESLLLESLRYVSLQMPPDGKLPATVIADFEHWISRGAADPRTEAGILAAKPGIDIATGRNHWAYRPLAKAPPPELDPQPTDLHNPIDSWIAAGLKSQQLDSSDLADRVTLIRRLSFDLLGIPPTPEAIDEFVTDEAPDACERLVDRFLASPHFGERWGRHWLSVARFGESLTLRGFILPEAWRYRDYVIESFNADRPFDRFVVEQLAGDLLPAESLAERQRNLVATTYLALGNINLEEQDKRQLRMDVVDEQLDAIGKGFLAQTIGCARCHDHKFDPIPTRDYYALAGILASTKTLEHANVSKWLEFPLPQEPELEAKYQQHESAVSAIREQIKQTQEAQKKLAGKSARGSGQPVAVKDLPGIVIDDRLAKVVGEWQSSQSVTSYVGDGYLHDGNQGKGEKTVTFQPESLVPGKYEVRLAYTPGSNRCEAVPVTVFSADGEKTIHVNQRQSPPIEGVFISLGQYRFEMNGQGFVIVSNEGTSDHVIVDAVQFLPVEQLTTERTAKPPASDVGGSEQDAAARLAGELKSLQARMKQLIDSGPKRPMYMSVQEETEVGGISIHVRGNVHNQTERVPRGFLQVIDHGHAPLPTAAHSGRQELGEWIASRDNPLTPRVLANRVWNWLFGAGLVRTVDNFGTTGESPSHPELLDQLAGRLIENDWSLKAVIREVVSSRTYRQASSATPAQQKIDPENRWWSHHNRRRLDAESLLDAILSVRGDGNDALGGNEIPAGKQEDYGYHDPSTRRAVYWPVFRNALPEIFEAFDFADPSQSTGARSTSIVAPQALYFLNDDWVIASAEQAARRLLAESELDDSHRLQRLFRIALGRAPTEHELQIATRFVSDNPSLEHAYARLIQALFAAIDFRYVD